MAEVHGRDRPAGSPGEAGPSGRAAHVLPLRNERTGEEPRIEAQQVLACPARGRGPAEAYWGLDTPPSARPRWTFGGTAALLGVAGAGLSLTGFQARLENSSHALMTHLRQDLYIDLVGTAVTIVPRRSGAERTVTAAVRSRDLITAVAV